MYKDMKDLLNPTQIIALGTHIWACHQTNMLVNPDRYHASIKNGKPIPSSLLTTEDWVTLPHKPLSEFTEEEQKEFRNLLKPQHYIDQLTKNNEKSAGALYEYLEDTALTDPLYDIILSLVGTIADLQR